MMSLRTLSAGLALVPVAAGSALGAWTAPEQASRGPLAARNPEVATNARGDVAAVWIRGARRDAGIVVSVKPAGEDWGEPVAISRRGRPAVDPDVAIDAQGRIVVVWRQVVRTRRISSGGRLRRQAVYVARTRDRLVSESRWSAITTLSSDRQKIGPPELAVADDGLAVVAWHWGTGNAPGDRGYVGQVQFVERPPGGSWTGPQRVSRSPLCAQVRLPRVAVGAGGHAAIWWQCDLPADRSTALAVTRAPGAPFAGEIELPFSSQGDVRADVTVAADGRAVAISADGDGSLSWWRGEVTATTSLTGLPVLGTTDRIDPMTSSPVIAANAAGDALSGWVDSAGRPRAAPIAGGLGVGAPSSLAAPDDGTSSIRVAVGDDRHGAAAWIAGALVVASVRGSDGTMTPGEPASAPGAVGAPAIAMDASGAATLLWERVTGGRSVIERASSPP